MKDFIELPGLDDLGDDEAVDLWVEGGNQPLVFHDVRSVIAMYGWWLIDHEWMNQRATAYLLGESVAYFRLVDSPKRSS